MSDGTVLSRSSELLSRRRSFLLVIDMQERLLPVIADHQMVTASVRFLMESAAVLGVPQVISEQYPKGLGSTVPGLLETAPETVRFEKMTFSAADGVSEFLRSRAGSVVGGCGTGQQSAAEYEISPSRIDQVLLCGIEAHICVLQTALDLTARGLSVFVAADAVGSRSPAHCQLALQRMRDVGCTVVSTESAVFEWCEAAGTPEFREISRLVRQRG